MGRAEKIVGSYWRTMKCYLIHSRNMPVADTLDVALQGLSIRKLQREYSSQSLTKNPQNVGVLIGTFCSQIIHFDLYSSIMNWAICELDLWRVSPFCEWACWDRFWSFSNWKTPWLRLNNNHTLKAKQHDLTSPSGPRKAQANTGLTDSEMA